MIRKSIHPEYLFSSVGRPISKLSQLPRGSAWRINLFAKLSVPLREETEIATSGDTLGIIARQTHWRLIIAGQLRSTLDGDAISPLSLRIGDKAKTNQRETTMRFPARVPVGTPGNYDRDSRRQRRLSFLHSRLATWR